MHTSPTLGALIREARERANLTRAELARRARTSPSAVARYETGQSCPKIETARRCVDACGFDLRVELVEPRRADAVTDDQIAKPLVRCYLGSGNGDISDWRACAQQDGARRNKPGGGVREAGA